MRRLKTLRGATDVRAVYGKSAAGDFLSAIWASQYGSRAIETEHLLGLMREEFVLLERFMGPIATAEDIRAELENDITRAERFPTSVEVPLSKESKKVLNLAAEEAERLAHRHVGTQHVLVALLGVEGSRAAEILRKKGLRAEVVREQLVGPAASAAAWTQTGQAPMVLTHQARAALVEFLDGLSC